MKSMKSIKKPTKAQLRPAGRPSPGSLHHWRTEKERALAGLRQAELAQKLGKLVDKDDFVRRYTPLFMDCVRIIRSSKLTEVEQDQVLADLARVHEVKE